MGIAVGILLVVAICSRTQDMPGVKYPQLLANVAKKTDAGEWLSLKCTKFDFRWDSGPDPSGGAYSAPKPPS